MYDRVGRYEGDTRALAARMDGMSVSWAPDGHGTTVEHQGPVRDAYPELHPYVPGDWAYSMLVALKPNGGYVPLHRDTPYDEGLQRYHVVLQTNPHCFNYHDGAMQHLDEGDVYTVDETREHASINWGDEVRVHLVVDAVRA